MYVPRLIVHSVLKTELRLVNRIAQECEEPGGHWRSSPIALKSFTNRRSQVCSALARR